MAMITASQRQRLGIGHVRIVVSGLSVGEKFEVRGSAEDREWLVARSRFSGVAAYLIDPRCPLGIPTTYTVTTDQGDVATTAAVTRIFNGRELLTDLRGDIAVEYEQPPGLAKSVRTRNAFAEVPGSPYERAVYGTPAAATMDVQARVRWDRIAELEGLMGRPGPLVFLHNHTHPAGWATPRCRVAGCNRPRALAAAFTDLKLTRQGPPDRADSILDGQAKQIPEPGGTFTVPYANVGHAIRAGLTVGDGAAMTLSVAARGDWIDTEG